MQYMDSHAHPIDPNEAQAASQRANAEYKQCQTCRAKLPIAAFGVSKISSGGRNKQCNECRAQYQRLQRQAKYGSISQIDDTIVRSVLHQNQHIIAIALALPTLNMECRAFNVNTKQDYKVFFGKSNSLGMDCICVFSTDGNMIRELSYSGGTKGIKEELMSFCKSLNLRLELTDVDVLNSKATIYYL